VGPPNTQLVGVANYDPPNVISGNTKATGVTLADASRNW